MRLKSALSKTDQRRLDKALQLAQLSDCKKKHGAILVSGGRTLAVGINRYRNEQVPGLAPCDFSTHAEIAALRSLSPGVNLKTATMYVARVYEDGEPAMSAPCDACQTAMRAVGIRKVVYTIDQELEL